MQNVKGYCKFLGDGKTSWAHLQVNGKLRGTVDVNQQATEVEIRNLAESQPGIAKNLHNAEVIKVIYVPGRAMNFVVKSGWST